MFQDDTTGLRFGNFEVLVRPDGSINELGRGGFGRTLLARHSLLNTRVALKIIDERHARDEAARARFLKEAREQARLTHPGIARITDCGQVEGQLYYAVELCPDGHLREFVSKAGPLSVADAFHILVQAAEALDYSHRNGVVHLDVKPSNLMLVLDKDGFPQVKLIDFGLVQQPAADASPGGHTGEPLFSTPFASPEQIRSRPTDGRSDIFSLGMTGWFLLTGHNPVEGAAEVVIGERVSAAEYEPSLPPQLTGKPRAVLARMIRKNPDDRYDNSADLLADLRACLKTMPKIAGGWHHRRRSSGALADRFTLEKGTPAREGTVHYAIDRETRHRVKVTLLRSMTMSQTVAQYHTVRETMSKLEGSGLLRVLEVREFNEGWAVVEEASRGVSLTETLRSEGALPLSRYAPLVWQLGSAMDSAFSAGLTNVLLDEAVVDLPSGPGRRGIDWAGVTVRMPLAAGTPGQAAAQDRDATMSGDFTRTGVSGAGVQLLARWVYFIVGGKNPPNSSLFSIKEYIAIPGLGDQGNQILARHLCGQSAPSLCEEMLRPLFAAEGLSWEGVGEKVRQARWGGILQESGAVIEEIESTVTAAEKIVAACEPLAALVPEEVKRCYADASLVYEAANAARAHQTQLSQGGGRATSAGQTVLPALREISTQARVSLQRAEAEFREVQAAVEKIRREAEERERRRNDLVESMAEAWQRTRVAAKEAGDFADECRRMAPDLREAQQLESLATRSAGLAAQLKALHDEAAAAPESQWDHLEQQIPRARQVAADAREMIRGCRPLLEQAQAEVRRREEEARRREAALAALTDTVRQAQQTAAEAPALVNDITAAADSYPELQEASRNAAADGARIADMEQSLQSFMAVNDAGVAELEQAQQQAATAGDEIRSLVKRLRSALQQTRQTAGGLRLRAEKSAIAAATLTELAAAALSTAAAAAEKSGNHGLLAGHGSPAAACLGKAAAAAEEATTCQEQIAALSASLDPRGTVDPDRTVAEARRLAAECDRQAAETVRHLREAEYYIHEAQRQAQLEEEAAQAKAAAAIAGVLSQVDREIKRAREAFTRAGQYAEVASATAAVTRASEAWSSTQARLRQVRQWQTARPPEAVPDEDFLQLLSGAVGDLATFADDAERALAEAGAAAQEAAREAEARKQQELEAARRRQDEERRQREEEARRKAAEEEARRQVLLAAQREQEEQARKLAEVEEKRRQAERAEQRRIEEEARLKAEAEAAEIRRREEEARRKAEAEAADLRKLEALARRQEEAAAAEQQRKEEEARRHAEAIVAEARRLEAEAKHKVEAEAAGRRRQEEEARRIAEEAELRRQEEIAAELRREAEAKHKAEAGEQRRREAEEKRRKDEEAERQRQEVEAKRQAEAAEKRRLAGEAARLKLEADAKRKAEAEARRIAAAEEKRRQAEIATQLKQEADAKRKAEADAKRIADAEAKRRQAEEAAKLKQEAEAKRVAEAEEKRRQAEIAAQLKQEADARRKAEAEAAQLKQESEAKRKAEAVARRTAESEEKRRQAEVAAELKRVSEARQKSAAEQERQQAEIRKQEAEAKRQAEAAAATVVPRADGWTPPRRSKVPLVAAAIVIIGGGSATWWAMNRNDDRAPSPSPNPPEVKVNPPSDPLVPPPPATYTTSITLSGDVLTKGMVSMNDITLSGHDSAGTTITDGGIQFKTAAGSASRTVSLTSTRKGIKLDPSTLVIRGDGDSQQDVTLSRETGRVAFKAPPAAAPTFYVRAILHWDGDTTFAPPGTVEHIVDLTKQPAADLPTGPWLVTLDDDEPEVGKPGKSGVIVDGRKAGTAEINAGKAGPAISLPEGMPTLLHSVMDWQTQESGGEETVKAQLLKMLADVRFPGGPPDVSGVVNGLARTASLPLLSYPLYLAQKDGKFFILRPQRKDFLILMNLGIDRLAMAAAIFKVLDLKVDPDSLNPAAGIPPGTRIPWRAVSDRLAVARDALVRSGNKAVQELHAEITSSLSILNLILNDDWIVSPADAATWVSAWKETTDPCTAVRIHSDGGVTLSFKMSDVSTRTLVIKPAENGQYPVTMPEGPGPDEKDTFSGRFKPAPQLPAPLADKLPE